MTIRRYSEDAAATFNPQLQRLEDLYNTTGNAMELITSGTLTVATDEINMDLGSTSWAFLALRTTLTASVAGDLRLCANHDVSGSPNYYSGGLMGISAGVSTAGGSGLALLGYGDASVNSIEATIFLNSLGFAMIGACSLLSAGLGSMVIYRFGSVYTGGAATSLQIRAVAAGTTFAVGSMYRLEGVRL